MTGERRIWVNKTEVFKSGWQFSLTGHIIVAVDDATVEFYIKGDGELTRAL